MLHDPGQQRNSTRKIPQTLQKKKCSEGNHYQVDQSQNTFLFLEKRTLRYICMNVMSCFEITVLCKSNESVIR